MCILLPNRVALHIKTIKKLKFFFPGIQNQHQQKTTKQTNLTMNTMNAIENSLAHTNTAVMECPICYDPIGSKNNCTTECGHSFCFKCIVSSMKRNDGCPLCRTAFIESSAIDEEEDDEDDEYSENDTERYSDDEDDDDEFDEDDKYNGSVEIVAKRFEEKGYTLVDAIMLLMERRKINDTDSEPYYKISDDYFKITSDVFLEIDRQHDERNEMEANDVNANEIVERVNNRVRNRRNRRTEEVEEGEIIEIEDDDEPAPAVYNAINNFMENIVNFVVNDDDEHESRNPEVVIIDDDEPSDVVEIIDLTKEEREVICIDDDNANNVTNVNNTISIIYNEESYTSNEASSDGFEIDETQVDITEEEMEWNLLELEIMSRLRHAYSSDCESDNDSSSTYTEEDDDFEDEEEF